MAEEAPIPQLECQLRDLDAEKTPKTVGDLYELSCSGLLEKELSENVKVEFDQDGLNYALHIVKVLETSGTGFKAEVTSYVPSVYNKQNFFLSDGEAKYEVKGLSWSYDSVLEEAAKHQQETIQPPPEKLEPYPFMGPIDMTYPSWVWLALAVVISVLFAFVFRWQRKRLQKKKLVDAALTGMGSALTPFQDFNKTLRKVQRASGAKDVNSEIIMTDLDQAFRVYLTRALTVPAFDWSENEIIRDIRKNHKPVYQDNGRYILRLLRELERSKGHSLAKQDIEQLADLSRRTVEGIDRYHVSQKKNKGVMN